MTPTQRKQLEEMAHNQLVEKLVNPNTDGNYFTAMYMAGAEAAFALVSAQIPPVQLLLLEARALLEDCRDDHCPSGPSIDEFVWKVNAYMDEHVHGKCSVETTPKSEKER